MKIRFLLPIEYITRYIDDDELCNDGLDLYTLPIKMKCRLNIGDIIQFNPFFGVSKELDHVTFIVENVIFEHKSTITARLRLN